MPVKLLNASPLELADKAIGKCYDRPSPKIIICNACGEKHDKDYDTLLGCNKCVNSYEDWYTLTDGCNVERMLRVANKNKHASTIEHINYSFEIEMSRACLQEFARHRMASLSVKSSRYTLKELKEDVEAMKPDSSSDIDMDIVSKYCVLTNDADIDEKIGFALYDLALMVDEGKANDITKYCMPEAYKTSLVWTVNARSLQNFLHLRTSKAALWEIRNIAFAVYEQIPEDHRFLFKEFLNDANH